MNIVNNKVRSLLSIRIGVAVLTLALTIPARSVVATSPLPESESSSQKMYSENEPESTTSASEMKSLPSATLTDEAEAKLRRALAAMTTRQWSGGWPNASTLDGLIVQGQGRSPMDYYWLTVQPPATPATAKVYVRAAEVLNDDRYLHHARMAQRALQAVQSKDGGFPKEAAPSSDPARTGTFDDNVTTGALDFFIDLWKLTGEESARQAVLSVGEFILVSQYPESGGWPQVYPPNPNHYNRYITLNDRAMANIIESLLELHDLFGDSRHLEAALRGGECLIEMQGPPGEDIWGAQHDPETLKPAEARAFEPVAYSSGESRSAIEALIELYLATGEDRFLEPLPRAFAWYDANRLPNGNWARFYEPGTMRPIYGDRDGEVYYRLEDISLERQQGYGWEGDNYPYAAKEAYDRIKEIGRTAYLAEREQAGKVKQSEIAQDVRELLETQHPDGWWIDTVVGVGYFETGNVRNDMMEAGEPEESHDMIRSGTFARNANLLLDYIEAASSSAYRNK